MILFICFRKTRSQSNLGCGPHQGLVSSSPYHVHMFKNITYSRFWLRFWGWYSGVHFSDVVFPRGSRSFRSIKALVSSVVGRRLFGCNWGQASAFLLGKEVLCNKDYFVSFFPPPHASSSIQLVPTCSYFKVVWLRCWFFSFSGSSTFGKRHKHCWSYT